MVVDGGAWGDEPINRTTFTTYDFIEENENNIPQGTSPSPGRNATLTYYAKEADGSPTPNGAYAGTTLASSSDSRGITVSSGTSSSGPWTAVWTGQIKDFVTDKVRVFVPGAYTRFSGINDFSGNDWYIDSDAFVEYQDHVTGPLSQGTGEYVSHDGITLELTNPGGRWIVSPDVAAVSDTEYTNDAPGGDIVEFQSANGADGIDDAPTTKFSGDGCTLRDIRWTFQKADDSTIQNPTFNNEPIKEYDLSVAYLVGDEVLPWEGPDDEYLEPGTIYRIKVRYRADRDWETR